jgi:predicted nucleotidyltransferase component of viral defense system
MNYSRSRLHALSKQSSFLEANLEKVLRLLDILDLLFQETTLSGKLVLKGGTAINLCFSPIRRLSVDIDLDYIGSSALEIAKKERPEILNCLERRLSQEGYSFLAPSREGYALSSRSFSYRNAFGNKDVLKIEINFLDRVHLFNPEQRHFSFLGTEHHALVLQKEELYGSKVAALLDRTKPRDLYDVFQLAKNDILLEEDDFRRALVFYLSMDDIFDFDGSGFASIDLIDYRDIRSELKPVLAREDPFELNEAKSRVKDYLSSIVLKEKEKAFLLSAKKKEFDFSLLSSDPSFVEKMNKHSLVLWKKTIARTKGF